MRRAQGRHASQQEHHDTQPTGCDARTAAVCETGQGFHRGLSSFDGLRQLAVEGMVAAPGLPGVPAVNTDRRAW